MFKKLKIKKDSELGKRLLFKEFDVLGKVNLLCGGNGVGKSTFIECFLENQLKAIKDENDNPDSVYSLYRYIDSKDNYSNINNSNSHFTYKDYYDPFIIGRVISQKELSEGQCIINSINDFLYAMSTLPDENDINKYIILIDEFDSGLSVDNIKVVLNKIKDIVNNRNDIVIFIAFNNYYCCEFFPDSIISMYTGKQIKFKDHKEYVDFICNEENLKLIKRGDNNE